jgi:ACR3 family arsenite efflux pump ArsB
MRAVLEARQVAVYLAAIIAGATVGLIFSAKAVPETAINPALAFMLFVTFLQVPLTELASACRDVRFLGALLAANFVAVPVLVAALLQLVPDDPLLRLAILLVLLTPCIDYVVTFTHLGQGDARSLLASTPILLLAQLILLPLLLDLFLGEATSALVEPEPFVEAFVWLIALPLLMAGLARHLGDRGPRGRQATDLLGTLAVPATALVLFLVVAAMVPRIGDASGRALAALPIYVAYAAVAPFLGWLVARAFGLETRAARAVAFSAATRNSLVVLPLAFAVPGGVPVVPAVVVTQTMVELVGELLYIRILPRLGRRRA